MIEIKNLTKRYGKIPALENFNLTVKDASIFGLVGINGSGKSTLLRLLAGVFMPDGGEILIDGQPVFENEKAKREIFFLPDEPFYTAGMSGKDLAELYRAFYNFDDKIFDRYVKAYQLDTNAHLRTFSKGMKRRMFVCLAFASCAKYLLLDEVFDGLDPAARFVFKQGLIDVTQSTGGTAVIASHSLRELEDICDSFGLIDGKKIIQSGGISESLEKVCKFQIAFDRFVQRQELGFDCLSFEASGRIIKIAVRGDKNEYLKKINALKPLVIDEIPVDFEEYFIINQCAEQMREGEII